MTVFEVMVVVCALIGLLSILCLIALTCLWLWESYRHPVEKQPPLGAGFEFDGSWRRAGRTR